MHPTKVAKVAELEDEVENLNQQNEALNSKLAEEVEKNDVLTAQLQTTRKQNRRLGVKTHQLELAVEMAQVLHKLVYDDIRGWFTDADHYPHDLHNKDDTWHYF